MGKDRKNGKRKTNRGKEKLPPITYQEGLLAYRISYKEKQLEDVLYEIKLLEDINIKHKERNAALKVEQDRLVTNLLNSTRGRNDADANDELVAKQHVAKEQVTKEQVADKVYENYNLTLKHERELSAIQTQIAIRDREIVRMQQELYEWTEYKGRGINIERKQIDLLQREIYDTDMQFKYMSEMLERSLKDSNVREEADVNKQLNQQRALATKNVIARMDKQSRQEVLDHDWLSTEIAEHMKETGRLMLEVEGLERENVELMSKLQQYSTEDVLLSRSSVHNQIEVDNIEELCVHEIDLSKIDFTNKQLQGPVSKQSVLRMIQQKISALHNLQLSQKALCKQFSQEELNQQLSQGRPVESAKGQNENDLHLPPLPGLSKTVGVSCSNSLDGVGDYFSLGPVELKHLSLKGERANLHTPPQLSEEEQKLLVLSSDEWPVTYNMLTHVLSMSKHQQW